MSETVEQWTGSFDSMAADWQALRSRRAGERLSHWELLFDEYRSAQQELRDSGQWLSGPADLLSIIGRARRETFHSAMLAWLLDPGAPHGLGTAFLETVLQTCFPALTLDSVTLAGTVTACEVAGRSSRADIVILGGDVTVVIEVKVDHIERDGQCDDLYRDFCDKPGAQFVFLTPTGRKPTTATGDALAAFQSLSFRAVRVVLRELCDSQGEDRLAALGRQTVLCYLQTLEVEFP